MRLGCSSAAFVGVLACTSAHAQAAAKPPEKVAEKPAGRPTLARPGKKRVRKPPPTADLVALNTHESFTLQPGPQGGFARATMKALARFLRCHHTQRMHPIAERLARLLYQTANHFGFQKLEVIAGYRAPRVAREKGNPKSPHKKGLACDFRVVGVTNETLRDYVRTLPRVGVGYYPNSGFVHLDVRDKKSAFWIDYSAPGERARYAAPPDDDVRKPAETGDIAPEGVEPLGNSRSGDPAPKALPTPPPTTQED